MKAPQKILAVGVASLLCFGSVCTELSLPSTTATLTASAASTLADFPSSYQSAADWIWTNRIEREQSTVRRNTLFDQIIAGNGELHYVVRWQSYKTVTLEQRRQFQKLVEDSVNAWTDWLRGYDDWPYDHITVKIVGWAVLDRNCLLDLQPDEVVYDSLISDYDSTYDTSNGYETIPNKLPSAPSELSRMEHFMDTNYVYPGERFDMYLWATQGFPSIGGCGGDWGQRLSDDAYLNMLNGTNLHVLEHELGHGFGLTDFYGGEGQSDGFPPGGFPGNGTSIMMAGSSQSITDFDGWFLRYVWSNIKNDSGRFNLTTTPATTTTTTTTTTLPTVTTTTSKAVSGETALPVTYDSNNRYWLLDTQGATHIALQVKGVPYSGVIGTYGYWDANRNTWQSTEWSMPESLGETGMKTLTIDLPASVSTSQIQIQVNWYARWDNAVDGMAERDASTLQFSAVGNAAAPVTTTATTTTTRATTRPTTTTTTTTTTTKATTTTTKTTTTTTKPSSGKNIVLKNVPYETAFDLTPYNDQKIRSITLQFKDSIPNSGGCLVLGNCWNEQHPIAYSDLQNGTITFQIQNPQDVMTIYNYYGLGSLQAVTLNY